MRTNILSTPVALGATPLSVNRFNDISDVSGDDLFDVRWLTWVTQRFPFSVSTLNRSYCERPRRDGRTPRTKHRSSMLLNAHTRSQRHMCTRAHTAAFMFDHQSRGSLGFGRNLWCGRAHEQNTWRSGDKIASVISFAIPFDTKIILRVAYRKRDSGSSLLRFGLDILLRRRWNMYRATVMSFPELAWTPEV